MSRLSTATSWGSATHTGVTGAHSTQRSLPARVTEVGVSAMTTTSTVECMSLNPVGAPTLKSSDRRRLDVGRWAPAPCLPGRSCRRGCPAHVMGDTDARLSDSSRSSKRIASQSCDLVTSNFTSSPWQPRRTSLAQHETRQPAGVLRVRNAVCASAHQVAGSRAQLQG
jgi:hypothetical protein